MKRFLALGAGAMLLGGCALPVPIQVASWALDGLSYLTTEKSVADHGISIVAQKDCAVLRVLTENGQICRDFDDATTVLADNGSNASAFVETDAEIENLANFETAAGGEAAPEKVSDFSELDQAMVDFPLEINVEVEAPAVDETIDVAVEIDNAWKAETVQVVKPVMVSETVSDSGIPAPGLYFVIGSFREHGNAAKLRAEFKSLTPSVLAAKLAKGMVFRVVVGPFVEEDAKRIHKTIYKAGVSDSWAIRVKPGEWSMAQVMPPATLPVGVASAFEVPEDRNDFIEELAQLIK